MEGRIRGSGAPKTIVEPGEILDNKTMMGEKYILRSFNFTSNLYTIEWCAKRRLIQNSLNCEICNISMSLIVRNKYKEGYVWRCKTCKKEKTLRDRSFFSKSPLSIEQLILIIYCWCKEYSQKNMIHEANLGDNPTHTIIDWCNFCREICTNYLANNDISIGGLNEDSLQSKIVEIGESEFYHRKQNGEQLLESHRVFGGVERESGRFFLVEVQDQTAETLLPIIERFILPGTIIISDGWRAYRNISQLGGGIYEHEVIVENFEGLQSSYIHRQTINNLWIRAKRKLRRQFGTNRQLFTYFLDEFVWRDRFQSGNLFMNFLICISEYNFQ